MSKQITVDADTLSELIEAKVQARMASLMSGTPDETFAKAMAAARGKDKAPLLEELHECKSPITGATFTARVLISVSLPKGRVVELIDYTHPTDANTYEADGGKVPAGKVVGSKDWQVWRYETYWKRDLLDLVGKPFANYYTVAEAARREASV